MWYHVDVTSRLLFNERRSKLGDKRKDTKGRVLKTGESQRKDGIYQYRYTDCRGKRQCVYAPTLQELRQKEKAIQKQIDDGIDYEAGQITVIELLEKYISLKKGVRYNTQVGYNFVLNLVKKEDFGHRKISTIKVSDAKQWFAKLQKDGRGYSTIHSIRGVVRPAFQMAVENDLLLKNPFEFQLNTVVVNDSVTREAISRQQERAFLEFVKNDPHFCKYYEGIFVLFKTGLRISEFVGLTVDDIDFENNRIIVDHQLQRTRNMEYVIEPTKTSCGTRMVPMTPDVRDCFATIIANRKKQKKEPIIGGKSRFLYLDKNGMPMVALHWEKYFQHICDKYNSIYKVQMPKITPHVCRHTFCSNMAKSGMNPKTLQYIMGHSDISVTLNVYTHVQFDDAQAELLRVAEA